MSYYQNDQNQQSRPGFSETATNFGEFHQPQMHSQQPQSGYGSNQGISNYTQPNGNSPSYGGNSGGYGSQSGSGGGGWKGNNSGGNSGGWKGNSGGGWKGGGGKGGFQKPPLTPEQLIALKMPKTAIIDGNMRAPEQLIPAIRELADILKRHGFAIRTGGMDGVGKMVMENVPGAELHVPWKGFNDITVAESSYNSDECKEFAKRYLPDWGNLKDSHQSFFSKNVRLVLGKSIKQPCQIAIIWSEDGVENPGNRTPQSLHAGHIAAMCHDMRIPVININNPDAVQRLRKFVGEI